MKAADDFASKVGSGKGIDKDKIHSLKKETSQIKRRAREIPRVIPREKEEGPHNQIKRMEKVQKTWNPLAGPGGRIQGKVERKTHGSKGKNNDGKSGGKAKKGQK